MSLLLLSLADGDARKEPRGRALRKRGHGKTGTKVGGRGPVGPAGTQDVPTTSCVLAGQRVPDCRPRLHPSPLRQLQVYPLLDPLYYPRGASLWSWLSLTETSRRGPLRRGPGHRQAPPSPSGQCSPAPSPRVCLVGSRVCELSTKVEGPCHHHACACQAEPQGAHPTRGMGTRLPPQPQCSTCVTRGPCFVPTRLSLQTC